LPAYSIDSGCNSFRDTLSGGRWRQRFAVLQGDLDPFVHDLAQFGIYFGLVVAVAAWADDAWALADEALILIGPLNNLDVPSAVVHDLDSSIT
jgi:hypothetical protein